MKKLIQSTPAQRASAKEKLKLLLEAKKLPLRTDSLARALTEIGKTDAFADQEAACDEEKDMSGKKIERKVKWFVDSRNESPEDVQWHFFHTIANQITQYGGEAKYNCVVYFDEKAFDPRNAYGGHLWYKWGYVRNTGKNPILGLQIMQSDPKVLLQATRAMLKRRGKDPIPIIDIYGKVFYP
ncbi:MAG: hypothetical protein IPJ89_01965 [Candidatus Iainarchaeum archaeon]|uniref:Uncharacterized protein n=1 Tax=Candidatus Iainarchaeum sp. TaxID=3101447 RepID=A0A7T9I222_9ARCH|nr:MAG: hypothetical protein IPJ89_01965 [Candidatus Diapherotrites archaeon]